MQQGEDHGDVIERAVLDYIAACNEDDAAKLAEILARCWAKDGTIVTNAERIQGREALMARISAWRRTYPECHSILTSGIEHHHNVFRFTAAVTKPDGTQFHPALDIGEIGDDGRIARIVSFHGELPPPSAHWLRAPKGEQLPPC